MKTLNTFLADESGATAVEYVAVTALASAGILAFFGSSGLGNLTGPSGAATAVANEIDTLTGVGGGATGTGG